MPINLSGTMFEGVSGAVGAPAAPGGLQGLFSGLVENAGAAVPAGNGFFTGLEASAAAPSTGVSTGVADPLAALQALLAQAGLQISNTLPADGVKIEGAAQAPVDPLQALADALQQVQQQLSDAGIAPQSLTTHEGLVKALQTLGVPAEKVEAMADTIEGALDQLKKKLGAAGDLGGDQVMALAQVLVAASVMPQMNDAAGKPLLADNTPLTFTISTAKTVDVANADAGDARYAQANDALKFAAGLPAAGNMAREVAGIKDDTKAKADAEVPVADAAPAALQPVADSVLPAVAITVDPVGVTVQGVQKTETPASPAVAAPKAVTTMQSVAAADVAKPADGEAKFVWKGEDTAQPVAAESGKAKADAAKVETHADLQVNRHAAETLQNNAAASNEAADTEFAKQLEHYQQKLETAKRYDVTNQAVVQVKNLIDEGGGEVRIRLNPPELGQIHVDLVVKNGEVSGKISATDSAVVNALASDVKQFGEGLKQAGFKLGNDGLTFMLSQNPNQGQQQQQGQQQFANNQQGNAGWNDDGALNDEAAAAQVTAWVAPDRLIDVNI
ncbi:MAG TPA: flagellar hook-length control protein FliK [Alphaproteobacteria bacterium]|nr:flagellar hook-length control protein FliK [Alphaproteobacteria bacterium]